MLTNRWGEPVGPERINANKVDKEFGAAFNHCGAKYRFDAEYNDTVHLAGYQGDASGYSDDLALIIEALLNVKNYDESLPPDPFGRILDFVNSLAPKPKVPYDYYSPTEAPHAP